jgi:hypothetical protein
MAGPSPAMTIWALTVPPSRHVWRPRKRNQQVRLNQDFCADLLPYVRHSPE